MSRQSLTDPFVKALRAPTDKPQADYTDTLTTGLALRVSAHGKKSWTFVYTSPRTNTRARVTFGTYPATSLLDARKKAVELRGVVESGKDPRDTDEGPDGDGGKPKTVADLVDRFLEYQYFGMNSRGARISAPKRSAEQVQRIFLRNIVPVIGTLSPSALKACHLDDVLSPIIDRGSKVEAARTFGYMQGFAAFAVKSRAIPFNPFAMERCPTDRPEPRERFLSLDEVRTLWARLVSWNNRKVARVLQLLILTGQRCNEVAGMERGELNFTTKVWTIPAWRVKNNTAHEVPLSDAAVAIIRAALADSAHDKFVFPLTATKALNANNVWQSLNDVHQFGMTRWSPHDLRRTFATQVSDPDGELISLEPWVDYVLNHRGTTHKTLAQKVYKRNTYLPQKRACLDAWAAFVLKVVAGGAPANDRHEDAAAAA